MLFIDFKYGSNCLFCESTTRLSNYNRKSIYQHIYCDYCKTSISIFDTYLFEITLFGLRITNNTIEYDEVVSNYDFCILKDDLINSTEKLFDQNYFNLDFYKGIFINKDLF